MQEVIDKIWKETTHFGSLWFYSFLVALMFILGEKILSFQLLVGFVLSYLIIVCIRVVYYKERPNKQTYKRFIEKIYASSFPSLHSIRGAMLFIFFSLYYNTLLVSLLFLILSLTIFASRYFLKKHYVSDIVAGAIIGFLLSYGIILII